MNTPKHTRGFTLIEMLVVIAIIAVLSAILFPVFARAREKGREAHCASNLRNIGQAIQVYASDNGTFLPIANSPVSEHGAPGLPAVIGSYTRDSRIFRCPSDTEGKWQSETTSYDYGPFNALGVGMGRPQRIDRPYSVDAVGYPLAGDFNPKWHTSGANVLFADGHVKMQIAR